MSNVSTPYTQHIRWFLERRCYFEIDHLCFGLSNYPNPHCDCNWTTRNPQFWWYNVNHNIIWHNTPHGTAQNGAVNTQMHVIFHPSLTQSLSHTGTHKYTHPHAQNAPHTDTCRLGGSMNVFLPFPLRGCVPISRIFFICSTDTTIVRNWRHLAWKGLGKLCVFMYLWEFEQYTWLSVLVGLTLLYCTGIFISVSRSITKFWFNQRL